MIEIAWIFPRHLGTYGDRGNLLALEYRAARRGIAVQHHAVEPGERLPAADLILIGGGQDRFQASVAEALAALRDAIAASCRDGAVVLGVCAGFQILGHFHQLPDGRRIPGLGLLDVSTIAGSDRMIGRIVVEPHPDTGLAARIVGFENHSGRTHLGSDPDLRPLGRVVAGCGNNGRDADEGAFKGNVFGTYLHGPLLPNNPELCDLLLRRALQRRGQSGELAPLDDDAEHAAAAAFEEIAR